MVCIYYFQITNYINSVTFRKKKKKRKKEKNHVNYMKSGFPKLFSLKKQGCLQG